ncbi:MAG: preprotein translocase subunit YajC [Proteobacteria bacterium]|nr:preprotein translocase subunit YajC [Pseudomonadota bacterium]
MFISNAYAQGAAAPSGPEGFLGSPMIFFILMFVVMYFFMIRPQMKRQKEQNAMMGALAKGDEVVTNGGMLGKVTKVSDAYVTLDVANGTEVIVQKNAIATLLPKGTIKAL